MAHESDIGDVLIGAAIRIHSALGPGLLESAYEACLAYELTRSGIPFQRPCVLPVCYEGNRIDAGFRLDLLVDERVVVELKAVERIEPVHVAQILTYLKLGNYRLGYLLNFNVKLMKDGIKRVANGL
jgi:GxxExxY protein